MRPAILLFFAASAVAQKPAFDVASVKINQQYQPENGRTWESHTEIKPGTISMRNVNLVTLIKWAYHVPRYQIIKPPGLETARREGGYIDNIRYDLIAKCDTPVPEEQMRPMMQTLLAERFQLVLHRETRTLSVYAIVEAKGGHKMRPSKLEKVEDGKQDPKFGNIVRGVLIEEIAAEMGDAHDWDAAVIDATGLKGRFDFEIDIRKYVPQMKPGDPPPDVFAIVQEALLHEIGLKLEPRKVPMGVLVINCIEKTPVAN